MDWKHADIVQLASRRCLRCRGLGLVGDLGGLADGPCPCVLRAIFRICCAKFHAVTGSYRSHEYAADFLSCARRALSAVDHGLFVSRHVLGCSIEQINRKLDRPITDRSIYFDIYRIEFALARAFCVQTPYALYPIDQYFRREVRPAAACPVRAADTRQRLIVPLRKVA
jgi:hypothetical protein